MAEIEVTVILRNDDLLWLERIVVDKDREEALKFAVRVKKEVDEKQRSHCKPRI